MDSHDEEATRTSMVRVLGHAIRVSHRQGTDPTQPPLVLLNGIGARLELLTPFVSHIDKTIPVISFDVPGVGGSPGPWTPYRFPGLAALVRQLVRQIGYRRADVLGISWGGGLAQQVAWQHPRFCRRVILCATATGSLMVPASPKVLSKMLTPQRYRDPGYAAQIAPQIYGGAMRDRPESVGHVLGTGEGDGSRWGYANQLFAGAGWTSLHLLPFIRQRTLLLAGDDDPIIPLANARIMSALLPHCDTHIYADGHLGLITSASELGPLVSQFLRKA